MATALPSRPAPERRLPLVAGSVTIVLALPLFLLVPWPLRGWAFGALLWTGALLLELLFARLGIPGRPSLRGSGVVAFGMMGRGIGVMLVAFLVATTDPALAVAGVVLYAAAYTLELGVFLAVFFRGGQRR